MRTRATFAVSAPAKVNLILRVGRKAADGYHPVFSIVQQLSLTDRLRVTAQRHAIELTCRGVPVPGGRRNLIVQAAKRLRRAARLTAGAKIDLVKRIPVGAGLGGGSSDAAAAALALNRLWGLNWSRSRLAALLAPLGSDVALFFADPLAVVEGNGERVAPLPGRRAVGPWRFVVVYPEMASPTAAAYRLLDRWRARHRAGRRVSPVPLTPHKREIIIHRFQRAIRQLHDTSWLSNDFEPVIEQAYPVIGEARRLLAQAGASGVLVSGSGSAVFGLFPSMRRARVAVAAVRRARPQWGVWAARPLRRLASVRSIPARSR